VKPFAFYGATCVAIVAVIGAAALALSGSAAREAVLASAALAVVIQLVAFAVARLLQPRHMLLGWGLGSMMRLVALVLYAVIVAKLWGAPMMPAMLSFAAFLFATTVVEPIFLKR
jgi:hypothetical protein